MLTQTFCHCPGIGYEAERALWQQGCSDWNCFLENPDRFRVGSASHELTRDHIAASKEALEEGRHQFFRTSLGLADSWRAWSEFRDSCVYLDIETDGGRSGQSVTMIGLYDGKDFRALVKGEDLEDFRDIISRYSMIVTFFGAGFDIPMLQKRFRSIVFDQIHLDLCLALKKLGYKGGLKRIEKELGISRGDDLDGLNGRDAIRLWQSYQFGSNKALETLIAYNKEDVVNLERLAEVAYGGLRKQAQAHDPINI